MLDEKEILAGAPLATQLLKQSGRCESFHMPGNRGGAIYSDTLAALFFQSDTTELESTGDLNAPAGAVAAAQERAALAFGAAQTFFLTGGATEGIQALLLAFCGRGGSLLCGPACHRSVLFAAALFDLRLTVLPGKLSPQTGAAASPSLNPLPALYPPVLETALARLAETGDLPAAVLVTSPNYYGFTEDIGRLAGICRAYGLPLLVDEAHGAHYAFAAEGEAPLPAIRAGASAVVQSAHKTLPALTPAALIHLSAALTAGQADRVAAAVRLVRTSSPSLLVGQTIDYARSLMEREGRQAISRTIATLYRIFSEDSLFSDPDRPPYFTFNPSADQATNQAANRPDDRLAREGSRGGQGCPAGQAQPFYRLSLPASPAGSVPPVQVKGPAGMERPSTVADGRVGVNFTALGQDPLRLIIDTSALAPAAAVEAELRELGIEIEFADLFRLVLIVSPFTDSAALRKLRDGLIAAADKLSAVPAVGAEEKQRFLDLDRALSLAYAKAHPAPVPALLLPADEQRQAWTDPLLALGRVLACSPTPYPPGIPLFYPGERLDPEAADLLAELNRLGVACQYLSAGPPARLLVL